MKHLTLKQARLQREMSQVRLAEAAGLRQAHISALELGKIAEPSASTVSRLENALKVQPRTLIFPRKVAA